MSSIQFILLALAAGAMIPFQSAMNAQLSKSLQSPYYSSLIVFGIATIGLLAVIALSRSELPSTQQFSTAPPWSYLGGILGGTYVLLIIICAPKLGIGSVTVLVLLGQVLAALIIDHFGLLNALTQPITWMRLLGVSLIIGGVYLVKNY